MRCSLTIRNSFINEQQFLTKTASLEKKVLRSSWWSSDFNVWRIDLEKIKTVFSDAPRMTKTKKKLFYSLNCEKLKKWLILFWVPKVAYFNNGTQKTKIAEDLKPLEKKRKKKNNNNLAQSKNFLFLKYAVFVGNCCLALKKTCYEAKFNNFSFF